MDMPSQSEFSEFYHFLTRKYSISKCYKTKENVNRRTDAERDTHTERERDGRARSSEGSRRYMDREGGKKDGQKILRNVSRSHSNTIRHARV